MRSKSVKSVAALIPQPTEHFYRFVRPVDHGLKKDREVEVFGGQYQTHPNTIWQRYSRYSAINRAKKIDQLTSLCRMARDAGISVANDSLG